MSNEKQIIVYNPETEYYKKARIYIEGDTDLVLNKMNARMIRMLMAEDRKKIREVPNIWEDTITAIHWLNPIGVENTYEECDEELLRKLLKENKPCITAFGLKKSFGEAVTRNEIDKYRTKIDVAVNVPGENGSGKIPVEFSRFAIDERLMSPQKGSPVTARLSHFIGWKANFVIIYSEHVYSLDQIVNFITLAGFGLGIGSGRSSGYGRYHVTNVEG